MTDLKQRLAALLATPECTSAPASDPGSDREQHTASHYQQISSEREKRLRIQASNAHSIARKEG
jgi:hypothetical protein